MDLKLVETFNGGDLVKKPKDLETINGFQNMIYLSLFGGNVGFSTPSNRPENQQVFDWWGNDLFYRDNPQQQYNSLTEYTLQNVALNSRGAAEIENAMKKDLQYMSSFANVSSNVVIVSDDVVVLGVFVEQPENQQNKAFVFIWDATLSELTQIESVGGGSVEKLFIQTPEGDFVLTPEGAKLLFI